MRQFWHAQRTRIRHIQAELWRSELMQSAKQLVARDTKRCGCGVWFVLKNGRGKKQLTKRAKREEKKQTNGYLLDRSATATPKKTLTRRQYIGSTQKKMRMLKSGARRQTVKMRKRKKNNQVLCTAAR